jgi:MFS transporter, DHA1 family, tetracycline resistance protein
MNSNPHSHRKLLSIIFLTLFLDLVGVGILIPIIPILLANSASPFYILPSGTSVQQGYVLLGLLTSLYPLFLFFSAPILGQLSDRYGRKKLLAFSLFGTCFSYVLFAIGIMTKNLPLMFFSRALDGVTGGNIAIAMASVADITSPENRAKSFGLIGAAFGLGFISGPFIGGKLADPHLVTWFNAATPFWFAAILAAMNTLSVVYMFPETLKKRQLNPMVWSQALRNIFHAFSYQNLRALFGTVFLFQAGFTFYTTFISVFLIERFAWNQGKIGDLFAYSGLWMIFTQVVLVRFLSGKFKDWHILRFSILLMAGVILTYLTLEQGWQIFVVAPLMAIGAGLSHSFLNGMVSRSASPEIQGEILGINASVGALAQAIPPVFAGYLAATMTFQFPLYVASAILMSSAIFFWLFFKTS